MPPKLNPFQSTVLQLNVGDRASLTCSVIKGDLPLTITWRKDNRIIDASQHISIKQVDHFNSILVIENLGPDHSGNYTCSTRNSAAEVEISQSLLVNGKEYKFTTTTHTHKKKIRLFLLFVLLVKTRTHLVEIYSSLNSLLRILSQSKQITIEKGEKSSDRINVICLMMRQNERFTFENAYVFGFFFFYFYISISITVKLWWTHIGTESANFV